MAKLDVSLKITIRAKRNPLTCGLFKWLGIGALTLLSNNKSLGHLSKMSTLSATEPRVKNGLTGLAACVCRKCCRWLVVSSGWGTCCSTDLRGVLLRPHFVDRAATDDGDSDWGCDGICRSIVMESFSVFMSWGWGCGCSWCCGGGWAWCCTCDWSCFLPIPKCWLWKQ